MHTPSQLVKEKLAGGREEGTELNSQQDRRPEDERDGEEEKRDRASAGVTVDFFGHGL